MTRWLIPVQITVEADTQREAEEDVSMSLVDTFGSDATMGSAVADDDVVSEQPQIRSGRRESTCDSVYRENGFIWRCHARSPHTVHFGSRSDGDTREWVDGTVALDS